MKKIHTKRLIPGRSLCLCSLLALTTPAFAATPVAATDTGCTANNHLTSSNADYVDCVYDWGPWALDIEPAAGGVHVSTTRPLVPHRARVTLRTNSIAALAPVDHAPAIVPISPNTPIPVGGPNDGF